MEQVQIDFEAWHVEQARKIIPNAIGWTDEEVKSGTLRWNNERQEYLAIGAQTAWIAWQAAWSRRAPIELPEAVGYALEWMFNGEEMGFRFYDDETNCKFDASSYGGVCSALYTESTIRTLLAKHGIDVV